MTCSSHAACRVQSGKLLQALLAAALVMPCLAAAQSPPAGYLERHWYDGARRRTVWVAEREVAVVFRAGDVPRSHAEAEERVVRRVPGARVNKQQGPVAFFRLGTGDTVARSIAGLRGDPGVHHVGPAYYDGLVSADTVMATIGEIIVGFPVAMTGPAVERFARRFGLTVVRRLEPLPNVFLLDARGASDLLALANTIYETGQVTVAHPNWIRTVVRR